MNDAWIVLLGTLFGGAGLKIVESWLSRNRDKDAHGTQIREELRTEIVALRDQLQKSREEEARLEAEIELWRSKYYDLRDVYSKAQTELFLAVERLKQAGYDARPPVVPKDDV